jgi:hypothetical protein
MPRRGDAFTEEELARASSDADARYAEILAERAAAPDPDDEPPPQPAKRRRVRDSIHRQRRERVLRDNSDLFV